MIRHMLNLFSSRKLSNPVDDASRTRCATLMVYAGELTLRPEVVEQADAEEAQAQKSKLPLKGCSRER